VSTYLRDAIFSAALHTQYSTYATGLVPGAFLRTEALHLDPLGFIDCPKLPTSRASKITHTIRWDPRPFFGASRTMLSPTHH
jgi:hypothetical protein